MIQTILEARQLSLSISNLQIVRQLDISINSGSCWGILGPNGAGKTTLLHALAGLQPIDSGNIFLDGKALGEYSPKALARQRGVLFQAEASAFPGSVLETILTGRHPHLGSLGWESPADIEIAHTVINQTGLQGLEQRNTQTLSGGERQRMEIATLLAQQPKLALLDEPNNHLDPGQQVRMLKLLKQHFARSNSALVLVLHDCSLAMRFCDHLLLLRGNGQYLAGTSRETATQNNLSWLYQHPVTLQQDEGHTCLHFE
jgi:iron complex transport system ATP-binding protein